MDLILRAVAMSDVVDNIVLRNETRSLFTKAYVEYGATSHNYNKSKVKVKKVAIAVHNSSTENTLKE